jgi:hypothetical protein
MACDLRSPALNSPARPGNFASPDINVSAQIAITHVPNVNLPDKLAKHPSIADGKSRENRWRGPAFPTRRR